MRARYAALAVVIVFAGATARAQESKDAATVAAQFFRAGRAAYDRGEYRAAALAFTEAYRRAPKAAAIYDAGRSWEAAGENELAADSFARALDGELEGSDRDYARAHLATLSAPLGVVVVHAPRNATITVKGIDRGTVPGAIYLAPGPQDIHVLRSDGSDVSRNVVVTGAGAKLDISFADVEPKKQIIVQRTAVPQKKPFPLGAWISIGAAAALGVGGAVTYSEFTSARSTFESSGQTDANAHDDAQKWRTWTYALWGGAIAFGALGGVLLITNATSGHSQTTASVGLTPNGISFRLVR